MLSKEAMLRGLALIPCEAMLNSREASFLYDLAASFNRSIRAVELGSWCGRGLWAMACGAKLGSVVDGVDICEALLPVSEGDARCEVHGHPAWQDAVLTATVNWVQTLTKVQCQYVLGSSQEIGSKLAKDDPYLDVLVIDADHSYESVKSDLELWTPLVMRGGVVVGHDYTSLNPGVVRAFEERYGDCVEAVRGTRYCKVQL